MSTVLIVEDEARIASFLTKGLKAAGLKKFAAANNKRFGDKAYIMWNFTKFLIGRDGRLIARFEPTTDMADVRSAIEAAL